jgi:hypothetical protein
MDTTSHDQPVPPLCPECGQPMELVRTIQRLGAPPEIFGFYCAPCKTIEVCGPYITPPSLVPDCPA